MADYHLTQTGAEVQSILDAVDDIQTDVDTLQSDMGSLTDLDTSDQSSLVGAINEVNAKPAPTRDDITGIVKSDTTASKTLDMSLSGTTLTITYS